MKKNELKARIKMQAVYKKGITPENVNEILKELNEIKPKSCSILTFNINYNIIKAMKNIDNKETFKNYEKWEREYQLAIEQNKKNAEGIYNKIEEELADKFNKLF